MVFIITHSTLLKKNSTNNLAPSRRCPFLVVLQGSAVWQPSMQGPPPGPLFALLGGGLLSTIPHVLWFTAAVKSISGASPDLFPFLMFLLSWINTSSKNEGTSHVGTRKSWALLWNGNFLVTDTGLQQGVPLLGPAGTVGSEAPQWVPWHPTRELCHNSPAATFFLAEFISTCSGQCGVWEGHSWCYLQRFYVLHVLI